MAINVNGNTGLAMPAGISRCQCEIGANERVFNFETLAPGNHIWQFTIVLIVLIRLPLLRYVLVLHCNALYYATLSHTMVSYVVIYEVLQFL